MRKNINIAVLGGDMRHSYLAKFLVDNDFNVYTFAQEKGLKCGKPIAFNTKIDVYIFPMLISSDGILLNTVISDVKMSLDNILSNIPKDALVLGGNVTPQINEIFKKHNLNIIDYFKRNELAILNAIPTAEGALQIAFEEMPITIHNSKALVLGNGKIGKALSERLKCLGAKTYVGARKSEDMSFIKSSSMIPLNINKIDYKHHNFDVIFNTVPHKILTKDILSTINSNAIIIDLASKPGGVDFSTAQSLNIKTIWALSLPGKVAPITSASFIYETIINILNELEVI